MMKPLKISALPLHAPQAVLRTFVFAMSMCIGVILFPVLRAEATPFTSAVPETGVQLPQVYPKAGGVAIVLTGANGNLYYQFSDPTGAFVGFNHTGEPEAFRGNPFTVNNAIPLQCGPRSCADYFGGSIARIDIRFSAYDGDTQPGGFDENDIMLRLNGFTVGSWSGLQTEITNTDGSSSLGFATGFGNNTFNTGWFSSTNAALLQNILQTGLTKTQVYDSDPNDNFWNFQRGVSLSDEGFRTIAPGYEVEKSAANGVTSYAAAGDIITYDYTLRNIGSVDISNLTIFDDKIGSVNCSSTFLPKSTTGGQPSEVTCQADYEVTQADIDAGELTNIATARGTPSYGSLGEVEAQVTLTGPPHRPEISLAKTASISNFSYVGQAFEYQLVARNDGNVTLHDVEVFDPQLVNLSCKIDSLAPGETLSCEETHYITQAEMDAAATGVALVNTATVTASDPSDLPVDAQASLSIPGNVPPPGITMEKSATVADYHSVGDIVPFQFVLTNTGQTTWTTPPLLEDDQTTDETCVAGPVAPNDELHCVAHYTVTQADIDAGQIINTATATVTVGPQSSSATDSAVVPARLTPALEIVPHLESGPQPYFEPGQELSYNYVVTNTGNTTLNTVVINDDKTVVTCPATPLAPGDSVTCYSDAHIITQADLDNGALTNTATATAETPLGQSVPSQPASFTVYAQQNPSIGLGMTAEDVTAANFFVNRDILYTYEITNTGNTTLTDPLEVYDSHFGTISCTGAPLAPGASTTCTHNYTVTASDVAAGAVFNTAHAQSGTVISPEETLVLPQDGTPGLRLTKRALERTFSATGETITYEFTIVNSGDTVIANSQPITISDPLLGSDFTCASQPVNLFPLGGPDAPQSFQCTKTYTSITQDDIDAGVLRNEAHASFDYTKNSTTTRIISSAATDVITSTATPAMAFTAAQTAPATKYTQLGDILDYTLSVENTGKVTLARVTFTDASRPGWSCVVTDIAPGDTDSSCSSTHTIIQDDLDQRSVSERFTAIGVSTTSVELDQTDTVTTDMDDLSFNPSLDVQKNANQPSFSSAGESIVYTVSVTNTGNVTLTNIDIEDTLLGGVCLIPSLPPQATDTSCTLTHITTQADLDNGVYSNTVTVTTDQGATGTDTEEVIAIGRTGSLNFTKTATHNFAHLGEIVYFRMQLENTGNVTLTNITINDPQAQASCTLASLAPGDSFDTCTGSITIDQDMLDLGTFTNTATATATGIANTPSPQTLSATATETITGPADAPTLRISKHVADSNFQFGNVTTSKAFTFEIENTGPVTLTNLVVSDPKLNFTCTLNDLAPGATATRCADGSLLSATHTIAQQDVDDGFYTNTVSVTGTSRRNTNVSASDTISLLGPAQNPAISLAAAVTSGGNFSAVGDQIQFEYTLTNTGNITLTEPITVNDGVHQITCQPIPAAGLTVSDSITCSATHTVTQENLDTGSYTSTATGAFNMTVVPSNLHPTGLAHVESNAATATATAQQSLEIAIDKVIAANSATSFKAVGDEITYEFTITNIGNVTITDPIEINDTPMNKVFMCPAAGPVSIAPNSTVTCQTVWAATQDKIDAGSFVNSATATATHGALTYTTPAAAAATALAVQNNSLTLEMTLASLQDNAFSDGKRVQYQYIARNTGNTTLSGPITINDDHAGRTTCHSTSLAPGAQATCVGEYVLNSSDIAIGTLTNVATAESGTVPNMVASLPVTLTIPDSAEPALLITKTPDRSEFVAVGDVITYTFTVTNKSVGRAPGGGVINPSIVENIMIVDDKIPGPILCHDKSSGAVNYNDVVTCQATYTVTSSDFDAVRVLPDNSVDSAYVTNDAYAETTYSGQTLVSPTVKVTVDGRENPALTVDNTVISPAGRVTAGETVTHQVTITNSGNQTVSAISLADIGLNGVSCQIDGVLANDPFSLAVTKVAICTGTHTVTQAEFDAQVLTDTAWARGTAPDGSKVEASSTHNQLLVAEALDLRLSTEFRDTTPAMNAFQAVGEHVAIRASVTNKSNVTLHNLEVTNDANTETCTIPSLAPNATDTSCVFTYVAQQSDMDRGTVAVNTTVTAQSTTGGSTSGSSALTGTGPAQMPGFTLAIEPSVTKYSNAGEVITYGYEIANTGNVTLNGPLTLTDSRFGQISCSNFPASGLPPAGDIICDTTYAVTAADITNGRLDNSATATLPDTYNGGTLSSTASTGIFAETAAQLRVEISPSQGTDLAAGDVVTITYTIENTGPVDLTDVVPTAYITTASGPVANNFATIPALASGAIETLTGTYRVTQSDVDSQTPLRIHLDATGTPDAPIAKPSATTQATILPAQADGSIVLIKMVDTPALTVGGRVTYRITAQNTGNVSLSSVSLLDNLRRANGVQLAFDLIGPSGDQGALTILEPDETWTYSVSHQVSQADIDSGGLDNDVTISANAPDGSTVVAHSRPSAALPEGPTQITFPQMPNMDVTLTISHHEDHTGNLLGFEIKVRNTGNLSLSNVSVVDEALRRLDGTNLLLTQTPRFVSSSAGSSEGALQPGEVATYSAGYVITQSDVDKGGLSNTAGANAVAANGAAVSIVSNMVEQLIVARPALSLSKRITNATPSFDSVGTVLTYEFIVANTGNTTLTGALEITDPKIEAASGTVSCPALTKFAPGQSATCTGSYTVTQEDLDAGEVINRAYARMDGTQSPNSERVARAIQRPTLALDVVTDNFNPATYAAGQTVGYTYTLTNTGNVTLTGALSLTDQSVLPADITCNALSADGLAPGAEVICHGQYQITADDEAIGAMTNVATAQIGSTSSPMASTTISGGAAAVLDLSKAVASISSVTGTPRASAYEAPGDRITYDFSVQNTGGTALGQPIEVIDPLLDTNLLTCFDPATAGHPLQPGQTATCSGIQTVTQDDIDAEQIVNEAIARTEYSVGGTRISSAPARATVPGQSPASLSLTQSITGGPITSLGQDLTFTFEIENTGAQALSDIELFAPGFPNLSCTTPNLAPGATTSCNATYRVTQSDMDAGAVESPAKAIAITSAGIRVEDNMTATIATPAGTQALEVIQTATPNPFGAAGSTITMHYEVVNTGSLTLFDLHITDDAFPTLDCQLARLEVGAREDACHFDHTVTQSDFDAGSLQSHARARGTTKLGEQANADNALPLTADAVTQGFQATLSADAATTEMGTPYVISLEIANTGNVSLENISTVTTVLDSANTQHTLDQDFILAEGDTNGDGLLSPGETWIFRAQTELTLAILTDGTLNTYVQVTADAVRGTQITDTQSTTTNFPKESHVNVTNIVSNGGANVGERVVFEVVALNTGTVTLTNPTINDEMRRLDGTLIERDTVPDLVGDRAPEPNAAARRSAAQPTDRVASIAAVAADPIAPGGAWVFNISHVITQEDIDAGGIMNSATLTAESVVGTTQDTSDDGDDSDGNDHSDPTEYLLSGSAELTVIKTVEKLGAAPGESVRFNITATNTGDTKLSNLSISDTMQNSAGEPVEATQIAGPSVSALMPGEVATFQVTRILTQADIDDGELINSATVSARTTSNAAVSDISDNGEAQDGDTPSGSRPTLAKIRQVDAINATKTANAPQRVSGSVFSVDFILTAENTGNTTQTDLAMKDALDFMAPARVTSMEILSVEGIVEGSANPAYDGSSDPQLLAPGAKLSPGETATVKLRVYYDAAPGNPEAPNELLVTSSRITDPISATVRVAPVDIYGLLMTKTTSRERAMLGDKVRFTLNVTNTTDVIEHNLKIIDEMPRGLAFVEGSATHTTIHQGRNLEWNIQTLAPGDTVHVSFDARVTDGGLGEITNTAFTLSSIGARISNIATAKVILPVEPAFDCAEVIGKVFEDINHNNRQDAGDTGIPGARLGTPTGYYITTDSHGRFSIPCAALPDGNGQNVIVKLDEDSLPDGMIAISENPRIARMGAGRMGRMNFAVAHGMRIDLDLTASAFTPEGHMTKALEDGLRTLPNALPRGTVYLHLTYVRRTETRTQAIERLERVETRINELARRSNLHIERSVIAGE